MENKITIDVRNCKTVDGIKNLLRENLKLPEWNGKNPDELLRLLKGVEPCEIRIVGANLLSGGAWSYMKGLIAILNKLEEMYKNIDVNIMDVVTIDFTGLKYIDQVHDILSNIFGFPDWYGRNLPALWDLLTRYIRPYEVHLKGIDAVSEQLQPAVQKIVGIFKRSEERYNYHKIILE